MIVVSNASIRSMRAMYRAFEYHALESLPNTKGRRANCTEYRPTLEISDGFVESGGGGVIASDAPAASADDDDGDGDGDPDPARRRSRKKHQQPTPFPPALIGLDPLTHYVGFGRSRIYQLLKAGFPQPLKIGKSSRWVLAEVDSWIAAQAAQRCAPGDAR